ncbi:Nn.00g090830.m01.CDS01 [Neocucurbitaria sp. VM-36]
MPRAKRKVLDKSKSSIKSSAKTKRRSRSTSRGQAESEAVMQHSTEAAAGANEPPLFFWKETEKEGGFLSPWYKSQFRNEGATYESVGHAIMAEKARIFGDKETLQRILAAKSADEQKTWGNNVKGFDQSVWDKEALMIATRANMKKFFEGKKAEELQNRLLAIGSRELIFASPSDKLFGIGLGAAAAEQASRAQWGQNLFGESLDTIRKKMIQMNDPDFPAVFDKFGGKTNVYW